MSVSKSAVWHGHYPEGLGKACMISIRVIMLKIRKRCWTNGYCLPFWKRKYELTEFNGILSCKCTCRSDSPPLGRKSLPTSHCWVLWEQISWCNLGARSNYCQCRTEKAPSAEGRLGPEICAAAAWLSRGQKLPPWERAQAQRTEGMRSERDTAAGRLCCSQTVCPWLFLRRPASRCLLTPVLIITYCRAC